MMSRSTASRWRDFVDDHPRIAAVIDNIQIILPPLNFITIHYAYFISMTLLTSVIFWGSSNPAYSISYVDSLFLTVSAMTEAGLNTINLSQMTTWQQVLLWLLIIFGSTIWVSIWTVLARKHVFEQRFDDIVRADRKRRSKRGLPSREVMLRRLGSIRRMSTEMAPENAVSPVGGSALNGGMGDLNGHGSSSGVVLRDDSAIRAVAAEEPTILQKPGSRRDQGTAPGGRITFTDASERRPGTTSAYHRGEGNISRRRSDYSTDPEREDLEEDHDHSWLDALRSRRVISRNSQFHSLSSDDRERLGGCEYRALKILAVVVPLYFFLWQFLSAVSVGAWIAYNMPDVATSNGANPWWAGIFYAVSAFNNSGMALLDANMIPFEQASFVLITMGLAILAGNTAYPLFLRLILYAALKILKWTTREESFCDWKSTLEFILKHPRRVYTNLFPSRPTWWLLFMLILLNGIDWLAFEILNIGNPVIESIPQGSRVLDGLFQALAVRSGGFYVIPISEAYIGLQVLYVIMMYVSVYPVVIAMRHSNVYEERSLGIYADDLDLTTMDGEIYMGSPNANQRRSSAILGAMRRAFMLHGVGAQGPPQQVGEESRVSFINQQIRGQLAHDIWWLVVAVLVITIIETGHFLEDPVTYSVFNVIFEVISAYGCVGISVGLPTAAYSFSGGWHAASKLVLCLVMLRGRHRGLPVALDRAVRLPGDRLYDDEDEDHHIRRRMSRRVSREA